MEWLYLSFALIAFLYAAVGHGGASGYMALMVVLGFAPTEMRSTALLLNILVSSLACYHFYRAGFFKWSSFWPFILGSLPLAFVGGMIQAPSHLFKVIIGISLGIAVFQLLGLSHQVEKSPRPLDPKWKVLMGAVIGLISGLTGVGGGIYLSPILVLGRLEKLKAASALAAPFVLLNSVSGLLGLATTGKLIWLDHLAIILVSALIGGFLGAKWGVLHPKPFALRVALSLVLGFAGFKLIFS